MSEKYTAISWNRQKKIYDAILVAGVLLYVGAFIGIGALVAPTATIETLIIRGFGTCAIIMLHVVLVIGPLCRLSPRFLPLLYNRRHLGVTTFLAGAVHGVFSIIQFHALGVINPLVSVLVSNTRFDSVPDFPFQQLGLAALLILFAMAATSHDFWLKNLSPEVWKTLHMLVYVAYGLLVAHVALGVLQSERSIILASALSIGVLVVVGLHVAVAFKERPLEQESSATDGFVEACRVEEIPENRAAIRTMGDERVAVFKYDGKVSAISNVCRHQMGPLGEGKIIDGCITCPWHGFQYLPDTGASPPPFTEKVETYDVKVENGVVYVGIKAHPPGTRVEPARA